MVAKSSLEFFSSVPNPEGFREPSDGTLRYRPYGAMPANPYFDEQLKRRQREIEAEFQKLFDFPPEGTPEGFAVMLQDDRTINEQRRQLLNFQAYQEWLAKREPITEELDRKIGHMVRGRAFIPEITDYALETDAKEGEYGKVTHPYRRRLEHVSPFRQEVDEDILARGGVLFDKDTTPYRSIDIYPKAEFDADGNLIVHGFIVPYKRDVGDIELPDGSGVIHIVERQLAGFRADAASGFNQDIIAEMAATEIRWDKTWQDQEDKDALLTTGCTDFIESAVQMNSLEGFVEPVETTIYWYKEIYRRPKAKPLARYALSDVRTSSTISS